MLGASRINTLSSSKSRLTSLNSASPSSERLSLSSSEEELFGFMDAGSYENVLSLEDISALQDVAKNPGAFLNKEDLLELEKEHTGLQLAFAELQSEFQYAFEAIRSSSIGESWKGSEFPPSLDYFVQKLVEDVRSKETRHGLTESSDDEDIMRKCKGSHIDRKRIEKSRGI